MKAINTLLFVIGMISLSSCASFKETVLGKNQIYLTDKNLNLINGTYKNNDSNRPSPSYYFFGAYYKFKEYQSVYQLVSEKKVPYYVTLEVIDKKSLKVIIKVENKTLKSYVIKGKVKNGYFEQNRKAYAIPAIIFNSIHSSKFRIGYLKDNNLVTEFKKNEFGTYYFFIPFNASEHNSLVQKRIE